MAELKNINSPLRLNNGVTIPCVGYGTFRTPADVAEQAVADAIEVGYRHIDTAAVYGRKPSARGSRIPGSTGTASSSPASSGTRNGATSQRSRPWTRAWRNWGWTTWTST